MSSDCKSEDGSKNVSICSYVYTNSEFIDDLVYDCLTYFSLFLYSETLGLFNNTFG